MCLSRASNPLWAARLAAIGGLENYGFAYAGDSLSDENSLDENAISKLETVIIDPTSSRAHSRSHSHCRNNHDSSSRLDSPIKKDHLLTMCYDERPVDVPDNEHLPNFAATDRSLTVKHLSFKGSQFIADGSIRSDRFCPPQINSIRATLESTELWELLCNSAYILMVIAFTLNDNAFNDG